MITDVGEYIVGAYLKLILKCDFIDYNVRTPGGGLRGLEELDVIGLNFKSDTAYLCEVTTHITGLLIGKNAASTVSKIQKKHSRQLAFAKEYLNHFQNVRFMYWSPVVPRGTLTKQLEDIKGLELFINGTYKKCINDLRQLAKHTSYDAKNPFFRMLQVLEHLRD